MKSSSVKRLRLVIALIAGIFLSSVIAFSEEPLFEDSFETPLSYQQLSKQLLNEEYSEDLLYAPNEIIVKFREETALALEREVIRRRKALSAVRLAPSLEGLNRKYRVKKIEQIFKGFKEERESLENLRHKDRIKKKHRESKYIQSQVHFTKKEERILKRLRRGNMDKKIPALERIYKLELEEGQSAEEAVRDYSRHPDVEYAQLNYKMKLYSEPLPPENYIPHDYYIEDTENPGYWREGSWEQSYPDMYGLKNIQAIEAWNLFDEDGNGAIDGDEIHPGEGVVVAVIDTGVDYNHPDLAGNMWINENEFEGDANGDGYPGIAGVDDDGDGLIDEDSKGNSRFLEDGVTPNPEWNKWNNANLPADDDENGTEDDFIGYDFSGDIEDEIQPDADPMDYIGHGSHCAGTIAAVGNNEIGIAGVAYKAKIMPVKIFPHASTSIAAKAIKYAASSGADVLSNSWGPAYPTRSMPAIEDAIDYAYDIFGCVVVFAAGNSYDDVGKYSPANYPKTIAVAAAGYNDQKADFSNWGEKIDVAAPGGNGGELPALQEAWSLVEASAEELTEGASSYLVRDYLLYMAVRWMVSDCVYQEKSRQETIDELRYEVYRDLRKAFHVSPSMDSVASYLGKLYDWIYEYQKGNNILSLMQAETSIGEDVPLLEVSDGYYRLRGTSMACPHVAGLAALLKSAYPEHINDEIYSRIYFGAENIDLANPEFEGLLGNGRINALNSLLVEPRPFLKLADIEVKDMEPGMNGTIVVHLKNYWQRITGAEIQLSTDHPCASIQNGPRLLGDIGTGEAKSNSDMPFEIAISPECQYGTFIDFELTLNYDGGSEVFPFTVIISFFKDVAEKTGLPMSDLFPHVVGLEDYNDDDYPDAWCVGFGAVGLYKNNQDRTFTRVDNKIGISDFNYLTWEALFIDIDNDGDKDLFQGRRDPENSRLYLNDGEGTFIDISDSSGISSTACQTGMAFDYNNDGFIDICGANGYRAGDETIFILKNNGNNTFTKLSEKAGFLERFDVLTGQIVSLDYNNDHYQDILAVSTHPSSKIFFYRNNGDGTFTQVAEEDTSRRDYYNDGGAYAAAVGDYNNDGYIDIFMTGLPYDEDKPDLPLSVLYRNNGDGTFTDVSEEAGRPGEWEIGFKGTAFFDFDNDGDLDLHVTSVPINRFYRNNGDGTFTDVTDKAHPEGVGSSWADAGIGDYNNDGALDVYAPSGAYSEKPGAFLENLAGLQNNWIKIKLEDLTTNRLGYGAKVYVKTGERIQLRQLHTSSVESIPLHFGLGHETIVDEIEVHWPISGKIQKVYNVDANQTITIRAEPYVYLGPITPNPAPAGSNVILKGRNFGAAQGSGYVEFPCMLQAAPIIERVQAEISNWSDTEITCIVPQAVVDGEVFVVTEGFGQSNSIYFRVDTPLEITITSPSEEGLMYASSLVVDGTAGDDFTDITSVTIIVDGIVVGTAEVIDGEFSYEITGLSLGPTTITVTAEDEFGQVGADSVTITVTRLAPIADFSADITEGYTPLTVNFTSKIIQGSVTRYLWDFGDNKTSPAKNPLHTYSTPGTYTVTLQVEGPGGKSVPETKIDYITAQEAPSPIIRSYSPTDPEPSVEEGGSLDFSVTAESACRRELAYRWLLDGEMQADESSWTFSPDINAAGEYTVICEVLYKEVFTEPSQVEWRVTVEEANTPPEFIDYPSLNIDTIERRLLEFTVSAVDPDIGDLLTLVMLNEGPPLPDDIFFTLQIVNPDGLTEITGTFSWIPTYDDAGEYKIRFMVRDEQGNEVIGDLITITVTDVPFEGILYVDASAAGANNGRDWDNAYTDLQYALTDARLLRNAGEEDVEIWVVKGTYRPTGPGEDYGTRSSSFKLVNGVAAYGGFAGGEESLDERDPETNVTILSGDLRNDDSTGNYDDNSFHVIIDSNTDETTVLDGFTITGGNGYYEHVYVDYNGTPHITIEYYDGAGMYMAENGSPTVRNCTFKKNDARHGGAIYSHDGSSPTFINCRFEYNKALWCGGAIYNGWGIGSVTIYNCRFIGNKAGGDGGAIANFDGITEIVNSIFSKNSASGHGGGITNDRYLTIRNCVLSCNYANWAGGIYNLGGALKITNSILWGNLAEDLDSTIESEQIHNEYGSINITHSAIQGWNSPGVDGNIDADPLFIDSDGSDNIAGTPDDNLRLQIDSPCIDQGDNSALLTDSYDIDNDGDKDEFIPDLDLNDRLINGTVDMGVYEAQQLDFIASPRSGPAPLTVDFKVIATIPNVSSYSWDFGDGMGLETNSAEIPPYTYNTPGTYTVSLSVTYSNGVTTGPVKKIDYIIVGPEIPVELLVDDFEDDDPGHNYLNNWAGWGSGERGFCIASEYFDDAIDSKALELTYHRPEDFWYASKLWDGEDVANFTNIEEYEYLSFNVKGHDGGEDFYIQLQYGEPIDDGPEPLSEIHSSDYFTVTEGWQEVYIPISAFEGIDKTKMRSIAFVFRDDLTRETGTIYIDNLQFTRTSPAFTILTLLDSGEPVEGAEVEVYRPDDTPFGYLAGFTGADGRVYFSLPEGEQFKCKMTVSSSNIYFTELFTAPDNLEFDLNSNSPFTGLRLRDNEVEPWEAILDAKAVICHPNGIPMTEYEDKLTNSCGEAFFVLPEGTEFKFGIDIPDDGTDELYFSRRCTAPGFFDVLKSELELMPNVEFTVLKGGTPFRNIGVTAISASDSDYLGGLGGDDTGYEGVANFYVPPGEKFRLVIHNVPPIKGAYYTAPIYESPGEYTIDVLEIPPNAKLTFLTSGIPVVGHGVGVSILIPGTGDFGFWGYRSTDENGIASFTLPPFFQNQVAVYRFMVEEFISEDFTVPEIGEGCFEMTYDQLDTILTLLDSGEPVSGREVEVYKPDDTPAGLSGITDADGRVSFDLPKGEQFKCKTTVRTFDYKTWVTNVYFTEVFTAPDNLEFDLNSHSPVTGLILYDDETEPKKIIAGARIVLCQPDGTPMYEYKIKLTNSRGEAFFNLSAIVEFKFGIDLPNDASDEFYLSWPYIAPGFFDVLKSQLEKPHNVRFTILQGGMPLQDVRIGAAHGDSLELFGEGTTDDEGLVGFYVSPGKKFRLIIYDAEKVYYTAPIYESPGEYTIDVLEIPPNTKLLLLELGVPVAGYYVKLQVLDPVIKDFILFSACYTDESGIGSFILPPFFRDRTAVYRFKIAGELISETFEVPEIGEGCFEMTYNLPVTISPKVEPLITGPSDAYYPDINGNRVVWEDDRDINWDIYMYDLSQGKEFQITDEPSNQWYSAIEGNEIVWQDERNEDRDIYMYNILTEEEDRVTRDSSEQWYPDITQSGYGSCQTGYGGRIVWTDERGGNCDVYMYDSYLGQEIQITDDFKDQAFAVIHGDIITWEDYRNGNSNIYMYNLLLKEEIEIANDPEDQLLPAVYGDIIVWEDYRNGNSDIYMYDVSSKEETQITHDPADQIMSAIQGNRIVWEDYRNGNSDIYMYDLLLKKEIQITKHASEQVAPAIYGGRIVFMDNRNGTWDIYMASIVDENTADFIGTPDTGDAPLTVEFSDQSSGLITRWLWDFGDGETSTEENPRHTYYSLGAYTVTLTIEGPGGEATETKVDYIKVSYPLPIADFIANPSSGEVPLEVQFTDMSTGDILSWYWFFGDGDWSSEQNPVHIYDSVGTFNVYLEVYGTDQPSRKNDSITVTFSGDIFEAYADQEIILYGDDTDLYCDASWFYFNNYGWLCDDGSGYEEFICRDLPLRRYPILHDSINTAATPPFMPGKQYSIKLRASKIISDSSRIDRYSEPFTVIVAKDSKHIQDDIDRASPGDIVPVEPGIHKLTSDLYITKDITLKAEDTNPDNTVFILGEHHIIIRDPEHVYSDRYPFGYVTDVTIEGITVKGYKASANTTCIQSGYGVSCAPSDDGPIQNYSAKLTLKDCKIIDNEGTKVSAIYNHRYMSLYLENTLIAKNVNFPQDPTPLFSNYRGSVYYCGTIYLSKGSKLDVRGLPPDYRGSTIADNSCKYESLVIPTGYGQSEIKIDYGAIYSEGCNDLKMLDSIMWKNNEGKDIACKDERLLWKGINYSDIQQEDIPGTSYLRGTLYIIHEDPDFIDPDNYNYNISDTSPCKGTGINGADMGARF